MPRRSSEEVLSNRNSSSYSADSPLLSESFMNAHSIARLDETSTRTLSVSGLLTRPNSSKSAKPPVSKRREKEVGVLSSADMSTSVEALSRMSNNDNLSVQRLKRALLDLGGHIQPNINGIIIIFIIISIFFYYYRLILIMIINTIIINFDNNMLCKVSITVHFSRAYNALKLPCELRDFISSLFPLSPCLLFLFSCRFLY